MPRPWPGCIIRSGGACRARSGDDCCVVKLLGNRRRSARRRDCYADSSHRLMAGSVMDVIDIILVTLLNEFSDLTDVEQATRVALRLLLAAVLGGLLGYERETHGKAAGVRTHMLVCTGSALFVLASELSGGGDDAMSRVVQGIVAGIGFLGVGTI